MVRNLADFCLWIVIKSILLFFKIQIKGASDTGNCPALISGKYHPCFVLCQSDSDCVNGQKCCFNGCGIQCMQPV